MSSKRKPLTPEQVAVHRLQERARYQAKREAMGKPVQSKLPKPPPLPKPAMTPSKHVAKRGPAGTAQEPDMSRAVVTVYQPPPSRYAATGPVVGGFAALGVGRYLNTDVLKG